MKTFRYSFILLLMVLAAGCGTQSRSTAGAAEWAGASSTAGAAEEARGNIGTAGRDLAPAEGTTAKAEAEKAEGKTEKAEGKRFGVVELSANFIREEADFTAEVGTQLLMGTPVEILGQEGLWLRVLSPDPYEGWCVDMSVAELTAEQMERYVAAPKYIFTEDFGWMYEEPATGSARVCDLVAGDIVLAMPAECLADAAKCREWEAAMEEEKLVRRPMQGGFVAAWLPGGAMGYIPADQVKGFSSWAEEAQASAGNIIETAKRFIGLPYMWGGTSAKALDCSGLTKTACFLNGMLIPRNASQQAKVGLDVPVRNGGGATLENLMPGDLIFFGSISAPAGDADETVKAPAGEAGGSAVVKVTHVGIYMGDGKFIHAARKVRINSLIKGEADYYDGTENLILARRVVGQEDKGTGVVSVLSSPAYFPQK